MMGTYAPLGDSVPPVALFAWGGRADARVASRGEAWRYLSSLLLHSSLAHLASNMAVFVCASASLERRYGWWAVLPLYIVAGVGGNIYSATFEGCDVVVGASGAVLGLCAAVVVDMLHAHASMRLLISRVLFLVVAAVNLFTDAAKVSDDPSAASGTSRWSHVGGAVCGFAAAALLLPMLPVAAKPVAAATPMTTPEQSPREADPASSAAVRRQRVALVRRAAAALLSVVAAGTLIFTFGVMPLNLAGMLPASRAFAGAPKACAAACRGWCACEFSAADVAAGTPCLMATRAFAQTEGGDALRALRGGVMRFV
jgi:membrane associated rhomboid family serine protease